MAARLLLLGLTAFLGLPSIAAAQSSDLEALAAAYPECSLNCMIEYIPQSTCVTAEGLNQTCLCTNEALNQEISVCAMKSCTIKEMLSTLTRDNVAISTNYSSDKEGL